MELNFVPILASLGSGLATGLGALPIFMKKDFSKESLDVGMGFSAGIMLVAAFLSLIVPGLDHARALYGSVYGILPVLLGVFSGYLSIILLHDFLPHEHLIKKKDMGHKQNLSRITLIILAIALHNIPEGLTVGVGLGVGSSASGLLLAAAIGLQNMPEGLVVALGLLTAGASKKRAFTIALLSGAIEPIAAGVGYLATQVAASTLPFAMGFAGGAMLFVICQEIFPEIFRQGSERKTTFGVISGISLMLALNFIFG